MTSSVLYYTSAYATRDGWHKPCSHKHPDAVEANKCALQREADFIVCDPENATGQRVVTKAPYRRPKRPAKVVLRDASAGEKKQGIQQFRVARLDNVDLRFSGELLGWASSRESPKQERWTEVRIWRTTSGKYIVQTLGRSIREGEIDRSLATVCSTPADVLLALKRRGKVVADFLNFVSQEVLRKAADVDDALKELLVEDV